MAIKPDERYIDLLKKTLTFTLWPEPPIPILAFNSQRQIHQRIINNILASLFKIFGLQIVKDRNYSEKERTDGQIWPGYADTMIGVKRLDNIQYCIEQVLERGIEGDFIETGVWRGGACIFMRGILATYGIEDRRVFVADSFRGLPKPDAQKYPADKKDRHHEQDFLAVSQEEVESNFRKYGLLDDRVVFVKGWFKDTLPSAPIEKLSILRLDGDMYSSTIEVLENLYPKLQDGGFCIIDDYALDGCRQAVDDYRSKNGIQTQLNEIDWTGRYWKKE